ncbi:MAG TPA: hypothetical protein VIY28_10050 [Pseudonocardiaceae bacterium]
MDDGVGGSTCGIVIFVGPPAGGVTVTEGSIVAVSVGSLPGSGRRDGLTRSHAASATVHATAVQNVIIARRSIMYGPPDAPRHQQH